MKTRELPYRFVAILLLVFGVLIAVGPQWIFHVCSGMTSECHYTAQADIGIGAVIAILALLSLFARSTDLRRGLLIGALLASVLSLLVLFVLIGVCPGTMMVCNREALPGLTVVGILAVLVSVAGIFLSGKRGAAE